MTNQSQVETNNFEEIDIKILDEQSKLNLDDWLSVIWDIFDELQDKDEDKTK